MINQVASIRYAKAYFACNLTTNSLKKIELESEKVLGILSNNSDLNKALKNKIIPNQTKKSILLKTFVNISEILENLIEILVRKKRLHLLDDILYQFIELYRVSKGIDTCYLISAAPFALQLLSSATANLPPCPASEALHTFFDSLILFLVLFVEAPILLGL